MPPGTTQTQPTIHPHIRGWIVVAIIGACAVAGIGVWQWYLQRSLQMMTHADFYTELSAQNAAFANAENLRRQQNYADAVTAYESALQQTSDTNERLKIQLLLASAMIQAGRAREAVPLLQEVVVMSTDPLTARGRASAAELIADLYTYGDVEISNAIFATDPYKTFHASNDPALTARRLHEYAASIYPYAIAVLRISLWYANQLPTDGMKSASASINAMRTTVIENLTIADRDIAYIRTDPSFSDELRAALLWKARVVGTMERFGDQSLGAANQLYEEVLALDSADGKGKDGMTRYFYAIHLAEAGSAANKEKIVALLAPLTAAEYGDSPVHRTLRSARTSTFTKRYPVLLASVDPQFKAFLMTLGWTEADFSS